MHGNEIFIWVVVIATGELLGLLWWRMLLTAITVLVGALARRTARRQLEDKVRGVVAHHEVQRAAMRARVEAELPLTCPKHAEHADTDGVCDYPEAEVIEAERGHRMAAWDAMAGAMRDVAIALMRNEAGVGESPSETSDHEEG